MAAKTFSQLDESTGQKFPHFLLAFPYLPFPSQGFVGETTRKLIRDRKIFTDPTINTSLDGYSDIFVITALYMFDVLWASFITKLNSSWVSFENPTHVPDTLKDVFFCYDINTHIRQLCISFEKNTQSGAVCKKMTENGGYETSTIEIVGSFKLGSESSQLNFMLTDSTGKSVMRANEFRGGTNDFSKFNKYSNFRHDIMKTDEFIVSFYRTLKKCCDQKQIPVFCFDYGALDLTEGMKKSMIRDYVAP